MTCLAYILVFHMTGRAVYWTNYSNRQRNVAAAIRYFPQQNQTPRRNLLHPHERMTSLLAAVSMRTQTHTCTQTEVCLRKTKWGHFLSIPNGGGPPVSPDSRSPGDAETCWKTQNLFTLFYLSSPFLTPTPSPAALTATPASMHLCTLSESEPLTCC